MTCIGPEQADCNEEHFEIFSASSLNSEITVSNFIVDESSFSTAAISLVDSRTISMYAIDFTPEQETELLMSTLPLAGSSLPNVGASTFIDKKLFACMRFCFVFYLTGDPSTSQFFFSYKDLDYTKGWLNYMKTIPTSLYIFVTNTNPVDAEFPLEYIYKLSSFDVKSSIKYRIENGTAAFGLRSSEPFLIASSKHVSADNTSSRYIFDHTLDDSLATIDPNNKNVGEFSPLLVIENPHVIAGESPDELEILTADHKTQEEYVIIVDKNNKISRDSFSYSGSGSSITLSFAIEETIEVEHFRDNGLTIKQAILLKDSEYLVLSSSSHEIVIVDFNVYDPGISRASERVISTGIDNIKSIDIYSQKRLLMVAGGEANLIEHFPVIEYPCSDELALTCNVLFPEISLTCVGNSRLNENANICVCNSGFYADANTRTC